MSTDDTIQSTKKKQQKVEYAYPTKSRCPRCGSTQTLRTSEHKGMQYRLCQAPICRQKYTIHGQKV